MTFHPILMAVMLTAAAVAGAAAPAAAQSAPPADDASARVRLNESSRHGEYVDIAVPGRPTPIRAFVVYPEVATKAPVVIVLHETYALTDWMRGIADQLAADGFIAIATDLTGAASKTPNDAALQTVQAYGAKLPAATGRTTILPLQGPPGVENWAGTLASLRQQVK